MVNYNIIRVVEAVLNEPSPWSGARFELVQLVHSKMDMGLDIIKIDNVDRPYACVRREERQWMSSFFQFKHPISRATATTIAKAIHIDNPGISELRADIIEAVHNYMCREMVPYKGRQTKIGRTLPLSDITFFLVIFNITIASRVEDDSSLVYKAIRVMAACHFKSPLERRQFVYPTGPHTEATAPSGTSTERQQGSQEQFLKSLRDIGVLLPTSSEAIDPILERNYLPQRPTTNAKEWKVYCKQF